MDTPSGEKKRILHIEDDPGVSMTVCDILEGEGYEVVVAGCASDAKREVEQHQFDLILLDLMLPDADGLVLITDLKTKSDTPIIVVSATARKRDAILSFKLGADDFIAKPFHIDELLTRVAAALRRSATREGGSRQATPTRNPLENRQIIEVGQLVINPNKRSVVANGKEIDLTPTEYRLLMALASRAGEVLTRQDLAQIVWGYQDASIGRAIDVHIHRLRTKITGEGVPSFIPVRGFGYKIELAEAKPE